MRISDWSSDVCSSDLLAARTPLHRFVRQVLTEDELRDGLTFAAATLVILPLLPDQAIGPFGVLNPRRIWIVVILVMEIGGRSEEHTSELQSLMRISYAVFCLKKKKARELYRTVSTSKLVADSAVRADKRSKDYKT